MSRLIRLIVAVVFSSFALPVSGETLRQAKTLQQLLEAASPRTIANEAMRRGDPSRGALVFHLSAAACTACHGDGRQKSPLGPDLAELGRDVDPEYLVNALLRPSLAIRKGYETHSILTSDGAVQVGMISGEDEDSITLRPIDDLSRDVRLRKDDVDEVRRLPKSLMPDGLVASFRDQREFLDLMRYVIEVAHGGPSRAAELRPSDEELAVTDDSANLDHAGIIRRLNKRDFQAGESIYQGYCFNCHGRDGNTPSLPTARAFGNQAMKFGADPYRMFMTLTTGNGLMAPASHLSPKERYQVVHYIRERFMKPSNPNYVPVDSDYLNGLPEGTEDGTRIENVERDFGPALASQLRREYSSVLSIELGNITVSYDLHSMDQAAVWHGGFLDLSETQHVRPRGEGVAKPKGTELLGLKGWRWGHDGTLDYPCDDVLPRGPMPDKWMRYRGHYLHGQQVVLSYRIDGRDILETPMRGDVTNSMRHVLRVGPGDELILSVADAFDRQNPLFGILARGQEKPQSTSGDASDSVILCGARANGEFGTFVAAAVTGDVEGMTWSIDQEKRLVLEIPPSDHPRLFEITRIEGVGNQMLARFRDSVTDTSEEHRPRLDPADMIHGGRLLWPETLTTIGYRGLQGGAYALDTLTIPDSTPWNTWFRTSALDFLSDGRMAVCTYGGDVWIVSGIDDDLLQLRWKRFAAGLYEPFGLRVVDGDIYVTCKDRLTRLHDEDGNGEADFYESFSADDDVSVNFHAFNFDLQTDSAGNFYYSKCGHGSDFDLPGAVIQVSPDGTKREVYCTGFRTPNGMGMLPDGRATASDNQGQWMPASKINLLRPSGYYGWVPSYEIPGKWSPRGGELDLSTVAAPDSFDPPIIWMPQEFDNSSGGQIWVDDSRFGPLAGHLLHTSFGKGWMSYLMMQDVGDVSQAAIIKLPFDFRTGIMRGRVNPRDGQVYVTGLQGWNGGGRIGLQENGIQRLRYTGNSELMVTDCRVEDDGLRIYFNQPLDPTSVTEPSAFVARQWNYRWQAAYGSEQYKPSVGRLGTDPLPITAATIDEDRMGVKLDVPHLKPVHQLHLLLSVRSQFGEPLEEEIYWTINAVPQNETRTSTRRLDSGRNEIKP